MFSDNQKYQSPFTETFTDNSNRQRNLFQEPRDLNRIIKEPTYSEKYKFIPQQREPSPVGKRCFNNGLRENTKESGHSIPQIDLNKPIREPVGCQSPIKSVRRQLFNQPRQIFYDDVEGSKPKSIEREGENVTRDSSVYTIPNHPKLFQDETREIMKYQDVEGSKPKILIDMNKPERDLFTQPDRASKKLFDQPRDWTKLPSQQKSRRVFKERVTVEEPLEEQHRQLFQVPRETMKYQDLEGSKPAPFLPRNRRKPSPTFASHDIFFE